MATGSVAGTRNGRGRRPARVPGSLTLASGAGQLTASTRAAFLGPAAPHLSAQSLRPIGRPIAW
jgi:hypothetical protein